MEIPLLTEHGDLSLREYLALLWPDRSQAAIGELFARGRVRSGGRPVALERRAGDLRDLTLEGTLEDVPAMDLGPPPGPGESAAGLEVLHEDERLIAVAKPSGEPVIPDREKALASVLGRLVRRELAARVTKPPREWLRYRIVHRIDRLTSGLVLVAKSAAAERRLGADFEARRVRKEYFALLRGVVAPALLAVHCPVVPGRKGKMRAVSSDRGEALTELEVVERFAGFTLVRARPRTGRTHQIRVHAWAAGHPLAIDPVYGARGEGLEQPPGIERLTLHAYRYELAEDWEEPRVFTAPLPVDFQAALQALRARAGIASF